MEADYTPFMQRAMRQAEAAFAQDEVPIGAVLLNEKLEIVAETHNLVETAKDATAHAEMLALREGFRITGQKVLPEYTLVVTLEPCAMCAQALAWARVHTIVYGASDEKNGGLQSGANVAAHCLHKFDIHSGLMADKATKLMQDFFRAKR